MSKKILKLDFESDYDFHLAGLLCGHKDFRLCFELNALLDLKLVRMEDVNVPAGRPGSSTRHSYYFYEGADSEQYHVISNRDKSGTGFYIPEKKNIDFFLLVTNTVSSFDFKELVKKIRTIEIVTGAYDMNPSEMKSAEAFFLFLES